jgi:ribonuclease HII
MINEEYIEYNAPKKVSHIKLEFMQAKMPDIPSLLEKYACDDRSGVITVCNQYRAKLEAYRMECERLENMKQYERKYSDCQYICGIDEV